MRHSFEEFSEKQRRVELKSVGNFVAKTVLVESAHQFIGRAVKDTVPLDIFFDIVHQNVWKKFGELWSPAWQQL